MAIDDFSPDRAAQLTRWKRNRDHTKGVDAVKNARTLYLPMQPHMDGLAYDAHRAITEYKPAAARTLNSHVGLVFRKPATLTAPDQLSGLTEAVEVNGDGLEPLSKWALREFSITNDGGILIDHPEVPEGLSLAQSLALDLRPFLSRYSAEAIKRLVYGVQGGRKRLKKVVLQDDPNTIRMLEMVDGQYQVTMWVRGDSNWMALKPFVPLANGKPLDRIPFVPLGNGEDQAPFDDIVHTNLTHYLVASQLAVANWHLASPMRVITGLDEDVELDYSPAAIWRFTDPEVKVFWNEFSGAGVAAIERQLDRLVKSMAEQGLRLMISEQAPAEAVETTQRREASENSILAANARHVSQKITEALRFMALWLDLDQKAVSYALNTDFVPAMIDPQLLGQLIALNQAGKLSERQLFIQMQKGEIISEEVSFDQHQAELEVSAIDPPIGE